MSETSEAPGLLVLQSGLLDTVQDLGRYGCRRYGVTTSGALDDPALRAANLLVGNDEGAAGIELTLAGPRLRFELETLAALAGADLGAALDGAHLRPWRAFIARAGAELHFTGRRTGCRAYLAVAGGIQTPPVLGSRSTWCAVGLGGFQGRALRAGDRLPLDAEASLARLAALGGQRHARRAVALRRFPRSVIPHYPAELHVRVCLGPQDDFFTPAGVAAFLGTPWLVTDRSDRMGVRLSGPALEHRGPAEIISDGIAPGSIQVPADGQPIAILRDGQTTGGYPKVATIITADLPLVAQAAPGSHLHFEAVDAGVAREALSASMTRLRRVALAAWRGR